MPSSLGSSEFNFHMMRNLVLLQLQNLGIPEDRVVSLTFTDRIVSMTFTAEYRVSKTLQLLHNCVRLSLQGASSTRPYHVCNDANTSTKQHFRQTCYLWQHAAANALYASRLQSLQVQQVQHTCISQCQYMKSAFTIIYRALYATIAPALVQPGHRFNAATLVVPHWTRYTTFPCGRCHCCCCRGSSISYSMSMGQSRAAL
jgi:hypothetical protein